MNWFNWSEIKCHTLVIDLMIEYDYDSISNIFAFYYVMYLHRCLSMNEPHRGQCQQINTIPHMVATAASSHLKALILMFAWQL